MTFKCYIDKNIILSDDNKLELKKMNVEVQVFNPDASDLNSLEYLLIHSKLPDSLLKKMDSCKYIGIRAHNTDYVNGDIAKDIGIKIQGLLEQHSINAVAEHVFSLIFSIAKNIVNSHLNIINNKWRDGLRVNYELNSKTLGIVGYGKIGQRVADIGRALGMNILIAGKKGKLRDNELDLEEVLSNSDVVSLHLSSGKSNNKYINEDSLKIMKRDSILINTARGSVLDYNALENELRNGKFLGVGLDVFENEPEINSKFKQFSNVIMTPHIGYMTEETLNKMNGELLENLKKYLGL